MVTPHEQRCSAGVYVICADCSLPREFRCEKGRQVAQHSLTQNRVTLRWRSFNRGFSNVLHAGRSDEGRVLLHLWTRHAPRSRCTVDRG